MKRLRVLSLFVVLTVAGQTQSITFDGEPWDEVWRISIDTSNHTNIWQIGKPQKPIFNLARSLPRAIITDTLLNYPPDDSSIFYLLYNSHIQNWWPVLYFYYKIDSDSLSDFGSVEASFDNGQTWINIIADALTYDFQWHVTKEENDSIIFYSGMTNVPFTGRSDGWYKFDIWLFGWDMFFPYNDTIIYKFTFQSASNVNSREGWLLDDFSLYDFIEGINDNGKIRSGPLAYPNPSNSRITFIFQDEKYDIIVNVLNSNGTLIKTLRVSDSDNSIDISDLSPGIYFYQLSSKSVHSNGKFIKF